MPQKGSAPRKKGPSWPAISRISSDDSQFKNWVNGMASVKKY